MDASTPASAADTTHEDDVERVKEATTMALYVAICLFAAVSVATHAEERQLTTVALVWGTTLGLALAHWFAFRLSARLVAAGAVRRHDAELAVAQFVGAGVVAAIATLPVLFFDGERELEAVRLVLAVFIAVVGFNVARRSGAGMVRSAIYGSVTLVIAVGIALVKNTLAGH